MVCVKEPKAVQEKAQKFVKMSVPVLEIAEALRADHRLNDKQQWILFNAGILAMRDIDHDQRESYIVEAMAMDRGYVSPDGGKPAMRQRVQRERPK